MSIMRQNFIFSLQKVLDLRDRQEEESREALASAQKRYQQQNERVQSIREERSRAQEHMAEKRDFTQGDIWLYSLYRDGLNQDLVQEEKKLGQLAREIHKRRQELIEKSKQKKTLENLKQNRKEKFEHEQQKEEQKEFDEMAVLRHRFEAY